MAFYSMERTTANALVMKTRLPRPPPYCASAPASSAARRAPAGKRRPWRGRAACGRPAAHRAAGARPAAGENDWNEGRTDYSFGDNETGDYAWRRTFTQLIPLTDWDGTAPLEAAVSVAQGAPAGSEESLPKLPTKIPSLHELRTPYHN